MNLGESCALHELPPPAEIDDLGAFNASQPSPPPFLFIFGAAPTRNQFPRQRKGVQIEEAERELLLQFAS